MKEIDPFERIKWTPPLFGWQYRIEWTLETPTRLTPLTSSRIWVGFSDRELTSSITIYARIEPKIRSHWGITITEPDSQLRIQRASSSVQRAIELIEEEAQRTLKALKALMR